MPPLGGIITPAYEAKLDQIQAHARETIRIFEEKYPDFKWWEKSFVEEKPAVALLMQSVNTELAFPSIFSLRQLVQKVSEEGGQVEDILAGDTEDYNVYIARLATRVLNSSDTGQAMLQEAEQHMTEQDREALWQLQFGIPRSPDH